MLLYDDYRDTVITVILLINLFGAQSIREEK